MSYYDMNPFEVEIPMKDRPLVITVKHRAEANASVYDLYYADGLCGYMYCNEHNVWIYKPHLNAALLLDESHIQHLGKAIGEHSK
jgi:hypothetical protein